MLGQLVGVTGCSRVVSSSRSLSLWDPRLQSAVAVLIDSGRVPVNPSRCSAVVTHLVTHTSPLTAVCLRLVLDPDLRACAMSGHAVVSDHEMLGLG
jgi:hypothetical protein